MLKLEEKELVARSREGDREAFASLYERHLPRIRATVSQRTRRMDDVDDLVQNTFVRAYLGLQGFRGEAAFSTWLTQIAMNLCASHAQSERALANRIATVSEAESEFRETWEPGWIGNPEDTFHRKENRNLVREGIRGLPRPYREALTLRFVEDRSYEEITVELQVPMGTVKSWIHRGKRQLGSFLQNREM